MEKTTPNTDGHKKIACLSQFVALLHESGYPMRVVVDTEIFQTLWEWCPPQSREQKEDSAPRLYLSGCYIGPKVWPDMKNRPRELDLSGKIGVLW